MAKNKNTQSGKKWGAFWAGLIAFILVAAVIAGVIGWRTSGFKDWTFGFGKPSVSAPENSDNTNGDETATGELVNVTEEKGIRLTSALIAPDSYSDYGIDAQADTAYTITASVNDDAVDKSVVGAVSWSNSSSAWASGKNISDYATLTQIEEYGREFRLIIKQAFGEPITVKVASLLDSRIYGSCKVDYLKTVTSFTATLNPSLSSTAAGRIYVGNTDNTVQINPNYGVGTVAGNVSSCRTFFTVNSFTKTELNKSLSASGAGSFQTSEKLVFDGLSFKIPFLGGSSVTIVEGSIPITYQTCLVIGGGNPVPPQTIANNFIVKYGCGDMGGSSSSTAGVSSIKYEIVYSYGNDYSVTLTYTDNVGHGFRNDGLSSIATITEINVGNDIVVIPN